MTSVTRVINHSILAQRMEPSPLWLAAFARPFHLIQSH